MKNLNIKSKSPKSWKLVSRCLKRMRSWIWVTLHSLPKCLFCKLAKISKMARMMKWAKICKMTRWTMLKSIKLLSHMPGEPQREAGAKSRCITSLRNSTWGLRMAQTMTMTTRTLLRRVTKSRSSQRGKVDHRGQGEKRRILRKCFNCRKKKTKSLQESTAKRSKKVRSSSELLSKFKVTTFSLLSVFWTVKQYLALCAAILAARHPSVALFYCRVVWIGHFQVGTYRTSRRVWNDWATFLNYLWVALIPKGPPTLSLIIFYVGFLCPIRSWVLHMHYTSFPLS